METAVLGSILLDNSVIHSVATILKPEDFSIHTNRSIYQSMLDLSEKQCAIDNVTLSGRGFDLPYLLQLQEEVASAVNVEHYAKAVRDQSRKRALVYAGERIRMLGESADVEADEALLDAEKLVLGLRSAEVETRVRDIKSLAAEVYEQALRTTPESEGYKTGLTEFDNLTGGLQPGETCVVAGRPSMGKSSLATQILLNMALQSKTALMFSLEMSHAVCTQRLLSQYTGVSAQRIRLGASRLSDTELVRLRQGKEDLSKLAGVWIDDSSAATIPKMASVCRRIKAEAKALDLIVVDYLQLIASGNSGNREQDISQASRALKALSKEMECPVLILSQLNRSCEMRDDKRPRLSDLRESGAIEQDADCVVMVYRHHVYQESADPSEMELIIRKQRNGPLGVCHVEWDSECMRLKTNS